MLASAAHLAAICTGLIWVESVAATALTAMLAANERSCYYADVDGALEKVGKSPPLRLSSAVD